VSPLSHRALAAWAQEAGFELCGFARVEPIPETVLGEWLAAGMDADMDWMGRRSAERLDVRRLLPGAQTVVALACNYFTGEPEASSIARYARGRDYHATLRDRLRALRRKLKEAAPQVASYGSVDSGPVMEKVWAARAGLGYVGRNGCFITPRYGSYVVLACLLLDAPVDAYADGPSTDLCGECTACVTACPTGALDGAGRVDSRRCLSYQTIENAGDVPAPLRGAFAELTFGCDICQDVCPLNRKPIAAGPRFAPRAVASLGVHELAALTPEQYQALVPGTALARAKYDGLRRNAAYALGAARDAAAAPLLRKLSADPSELVRNAARWALAQLGT
jgi:epoxyqueuosine reductase